MGERGARLEGKVAIVTGAASGIGRAVARLFAEHSARVVVADRSPEGQRVVEAIHSAGGLAHFVPTDVTQAADTAHLVDAALDCYGRLDVLVNSAGVILVKGLLETTEQEWEHVLDVHLKGSFLAARAAAPAMARAGGGAIVNVASTLAFKGDPQYGAYSVAKGGVVSMTRVLARELAPWNIRVNCLCPGTIETPMLEHFLRLQPDPDLARRRLIERRPLRRLGQPEDVAYAALYLASDEAAWVTGTMLFVDGGSTA